MAYLEIFFAPLDQNLSKNSVAIIRQSFEPCLRVEDPTRQRATRPDDHAGLVQSGCCPLQRFRAPFWPGLGLTRSVKRDRVRQAVQGVIVCGRVVNCRVGNGC